MSDPAKHLQVVLRRLRTEHDTGKVDLGTPQADLGAVDPLLCTLVYSLVLWECSTNQAKLAYRRLCEAFVDFNELRICLAPEIAAVLGDRYPLATERSHRIKAALNDVFKREHTLSLAALTNAAKRESRQYLESLDGVPPFVSARVALLEIESHAVPADQRLVALLKAERALPHEDLTPEAAVAWLERHVRAEEAREVAALLQAWSDQHGSSPKKDGAFRAQPKRDPEPPGRAKPEVPEPKTEKPKKPAKTTPSKKSGK